MRTRSRVHLLVPVEPNGRDLAACIEQLPGARVAQAPTIWISTGPYEAPPYELPQQSPFVEAARSCMNSGGCFAKAVQGIGRMVNAAGQAIDENLVDPISLITKQQLQAGGIEYQPRFNPINNVMPAPDWNYAPGSSIRYR